MKLNKKLVTGGLALLTAFSAVAQDNTEEAAKEKSDFLNTISVGGGLGLSLIHGDIRQYDWYPVTSYHNELGLGGYVQATKLLNPVFSVQGRFGLQSLNGTRRNTGNSNTYSDANVLTTSANIVINISNLFVTKKERKITYYAAAGLGLINFRAVNYRFDSDLVFNQFGYEPTTDGSLGEKSDMTTETVVPFSLGAKYRLTENLAATAEITLTATNTDKLDARVQGGGNDAYSLTSVGVTYSFAAHTESEEWVDPLSVAVNEINDMKEKVDGLTKDSDQDGVPDINDKEPKTPAGVAVDGAGRALDVDGDGVPDHMDADITTAKNAKVDGNGKELDSDGDGVADSRDLEPNTEKGAMVNFQGVTINSKSTGGATATVASNLPAVYFNLNSASIDYKSYTALADIAKQLKANPELKLVAVGHTDASGSASYNEKLGKRRAQAVIDHLAKVYGIDASRISAESKGKSEPLAKKGAANMNRRVDFRIVE